MSQDYQPYPENFERALAVVAHPDDLEYGGAAAIARWTAQGEGAEAAAERLPGARLATAFEVIAT